MKEFKIVTNGTWGDFIKVESARLDESIEYINKHLIKNIELSYYDGYKLKDIEFLKRITHPIEGLNVLDGDIKLDGLNNYKELKFLNVADDLKQDLDFSNFLKLQKCILLWNRKIKNLQNCQDLSELLIKKMDLKGNLDLLTQLPVRSITSFSLIQPKLDNLEFIREFDKLRDLQIYYSSTLKDINGLQFIKGTIRKLILDHTPNIYSYDILGELSLLEYLNVTDNKTIGSLSFVQDLNRLKHLSFVGSTVVDGVLEYCKGIEFVGFDNKKHYIVPDELKP